MWIIWDEQLIDLTCHSHIFSISGNPFFSYLMGFWIVSRDCFPWLHLRPRRFIWGEIFPPRMKEDFWRICVKGSSLKNDRFSGQFITFSTSWKAVCALF